MTVSAKSAVVLALAVAFNASTALLALPLYARLYSSPGLIETARLALLVQIVPTLGLLAVDLFVRRLLGVRWERTLMAVYAAAASVSVLRLFQVMNDIELSQFPTWSKLAALTLLGLFLVWLVLVRAETIARYFAQLAPVFVGLTVYVIVAAVVVAVNTPQAMSARAGAPAEDTVVILVFDELGRDVLLNGGELDGRRFPNLRALSEDGVWLTNSTTSFSSTCKVFPVLVTGRAVDQQNCSDFVLTTGEDNLFSELASRYDVHVYEEYLRDCEQPSRFTCKGVPYLIARYPFNRLAAHFVPNSLRIGPVADLLGRAAGSFTWAMWNEFINDLKGDRAGGGAYFMHLLLPHHPFAYDATGHLHAPGSDHFTGDPLLDESAYVNYEMQVRLVDHLVGTVTAVLRSTGQYGRSTIVVTGDHGPLVPVPDGAGELLDVSRETPNIPMIIKNPRIESGILDIDYQHVDFLPTLIDLLDLTSPVRVDGISAFSKDRPQREKLFKSGQEAFLLDRSTNRWVAMGEP